MHPCEEGLINISCVLSCFTHTEPRTKMMLIDSSRVYEKRVVVEMCFIFYVQS